MNQLLSDKHGAVHSADFPLRGFITCGDCNKPLTANWSKSKTGKKHPYYMCFSKGCDSYRKSIRRDVLEGEFEALVQTLQPEQGLLSCAKAMFKHAWNQRLAQSQAITHALKRDVTKIEKQMETLIDRLVDATTPTAVIAYEARLEKLERQKLILSEKAQEKPAKHGTFNELFELAVSFLSSPWILWQTDNLTLKKTVLRLAFSERIAYCRKEGLRTPKTSLPFKMLRDIGMGQNKMAGLGGETSNTNTDALFNTLEEWNTYLKAEDIDLKSVETKRDIKRHPPPRRPVLRGPSI